MIMIETNTTAATARTVGLADRAIHAARAYRAADPDGFNRRHDDPEQWARWARRARVARTIAAALRVSVGRVTVTDDAHRTHHTRRGPVPGDMITVTDAASGHAWRFIPDMTTPGDGWFLIDNCPGCDASVPVTRIATLADLGDYLDPNGDVRPADQFHDDPAHQAGCSFDPASTTTCDSGQESTMD
jgi:hypothetical protein